MNSLDVLKELLQEFDNEVLQFQEIDAVKDALRKVLDVVEAAIRLRHAYHGNASTTLFEEFDAFSDALDEVTK
ncbi:MAG TPA: hypothetical protein VE954_43315 [Oligoflexus sp.]|uniref:hypothetical protein n=1 Tax=Oligoflexus sp. TaxID=1971216 RepID=UPI002D59517D|nr:hypothetical protein [Oligoflexus sp.]HYX39975.1 hypothetical protein [Oligoflexus sp.]